MKKIALTGGGTGWHIFPLISIYNYLKNEKEVEFMWFWDEDGLEAEIAQKNNIAFEHIPSGKIRRYFDWKNFFEPTKNLSGILWGIYYIIKYDIDIIFSKGGYVGLPLCVAGYILWKKVYIHESDTTGWLANKLIAKVATKVFYSFGNELIDGEKHILTWQILNPELLNKVDRVWESEENEKLEVLVIAGSQGSTIIFENLKTILNNLIDINFTIILWEKNIHFREAFQGFHNVKLYDFISQEDLWAVYKKTDIALTRAGATTLWELYFFGIHSIIIPLKTAAQNHQETNAHYFKKEFWSDILDEENRLNLEIFRLLSKYKDLRKAKLNLKHFFYALEKIKEEIL
jgi:UDP-N-acetylglucosamine--N-acetylmuramyl-(pentapeptide) pyrophosphoryl-undecaprenol N-acetylglucosamine transferase